MSPELPFGLRPSKKLHTILRVTEEKCEVQADRTIGRNIDKVKQCGERKVSEGFCTESRFGWDCPLNLLLFNLLIAG